MNEFQILAVSLLIISGLFMLAAIFVVCRESKRISKNISIIYKKYNEILVRVYKLQDIYENYYKIHTTKDKGEEICERKD